MEQFVCDTHFSFGEINSLNDESDLKKGTYIVIIHSDKIPPHVGVLVDNLFFSLKVSGKDIDIPYKVLLNTLNKRNISTLFVQLKKLEKWSLEAIRDCFYSDSLGIEKEETCLSPLIKIIQPSENCNILVDLLSYLDKKDYIQGCIGLNLPIDYQGIPNYSSEDVIKRLNQLLDVKRK